MVSDQYEIQMVKKNGEPIWMQISGVPIKDSQNAVTGSFGIIADIHSRKLAEQALRRAHSELEQRVEERTAELLKSNESLQREINERIQLEEERQKFISLVENSNDVITMATPDGKLIYINECGITAMMSSPWQPRTANLFISMNVG
jgi:PAS domain-containing protein